MKVTKLVLVLVISAVFVDVFAENIVFDSRLGAKLLFEAGNENTYKLVNNMIPQPNLYTCGLTSFVCVLNAMKFSPTPIPPEYFYNDNASYPFWTVTQTGNHPCMTKILPSGRTFGFALKEAADILECLGLKVDLVYASSFKSVHAFEKSLSLALTNSFVIANIFHSAIEESGGGHFSPIGAYHAETRRFLFLDTARYKFPFVWVESETLFNAMKTIDRDLSRGYLVLHDVKKNIKNDDNKRNHLRYQDHFDVRNK